LVCYKCKKEYKIIKSPSGRSVELFWQGTCKDCKTNPKGKVFK